MDNINIITPINSLGYGVAGLNIVKALSKKTNVSLWPIGNINVTTQEDADYLKPCIYNAIKPDFDAPCVRIWHQHDMSQFVGKGKRIGFPIFELDQFNDIEKHHLNSLDAIFVCSNWAKVVCENNLSVDPSNINVVPLGVDTKIFKPCPVSNNQTTIFFNCGKWEVRKGHDILPEIFSCAFNENDDVELWMMCENPFLSENEEKEWKNLYTKSKLGHKIRFINRKQTQQEVYNIMSHVDCGVFPSKAEGWNLELLELMSCGKQVIATNYSAHTEFCNASNSMLVDISSTELAKDGKWFTKDVGSWAKIDNNAKEQIVVHMREVFKEKSNNKLEINEQGIATANLFSWINSAEKLLQHV